MDFSATDVVVAIPAYLAGLATPWLTHWLTIRREEAAEARDRERRSIDEAYAPAVQAIADMIESFPSCEVHRSRLREVFRDRSALFDAEDIEHLWVAVSPRASMDDLVEVSEALEKVLRERQAA